ncbi:MAG: TIGR02677 family protein [Chromatiaceae bacterium]|jgi:uncharacterized protein (TIGR02677 family)|nr:TIGR02677 family protein [Chromatiaceae bacterium]
MSDTPFNYLSADKSTVYRAVMRAFSQAKEHFVVHLRPEDVHERCSVRGLALPLEEVQQALGQLVAWGNLQAEPDTSRVTSVEDFYRARYLYQITREGEAAEAALALFERLLGRRGALQSVALHDIHTQLRALLALLDDPEADLARTHLLLRDITRVFADLAENARAFMTDLSRGLDLRTAQREGFLAYKDRLIDYLQRFVGDLVTQSAEIAGLIRALDAHSGFRDRLAGIAEREAEDLAPDLEGVESDRGSRREAALREWLARWDGLKAWFIGALGHPSQAELLRARARRAIAQLLDAVVRLNERRLGRSDRAADYRTLARWFMECEDDAEAHRLWRAAFGLSPARHLGLDAETQAERERDPVPPATPWREAPPLRISPRLRETGSLRRRGAPPQVRDRREGKRRLAGLLASESAQARAARRRLATGREILLSELGTLDRDAFALFLLLLGEALSAASHPEAKVETLTSDGAIAIELTPLGPDTLAELWTPDGVFSGRDHRIRITDLEVSARLPAEPARRDREAAA